MPCGTCGSWADECACTRERDAHEALEALGYHVESTTLRLSTDGYLGYMDGMPSWYAKRMHAQIRSEWTL